jgi:hypothetical protein
VSLNVFLNSFIWAEILIFKWRYHLIENSDRTFKYILKISQKDLYAQYKIVSSSVEGHELNFHLLILVQCSQLSDMKNIA